MKVRSPVVLTRLFELTLQLRESQPFFYTFSRLCYALPGWARSCTRFTITRTPPCGDDHFFFYNVLGRVTSLYGVVRFNTLS